MSQRLWIGIDVGGTKVSAGVVDASGKLLAREKVATSKAETSKQVLGLVGDLVEDVCEKVGVPVNRMKGIGIGVPGLVDPVQGRVLKTPNMALSGVSLRQRLKKQFRVSVAVGNDVNLGLLGERWLGAARQMSCVIGIFLGTGVGGAAIVNGQLYTGAHGAAAEIGHMMMQDDGPVCGCGGRGCLEAFCGRWAIERDIRKRIKQGHKLRYTKIGDCKVIKSKFLAKALEKKDPIVSSVMRSSADILGKACVSLRHIFDPQLFVFGGGVVEACGDFILPLVQKEIDRDQFFSRLGRCRAVASKLGDDAILLGAVVFVRQTLGDKV